MRRKRQRVVKIEAKAIHDHLGRPQRSLLGSSQRTGLTAGAAWQIRRALKKEVTWGYLPCSGVKFYIQQARRDMALGLPGSAKFAE